MKTIMKLKTLVLAALAGASACGADIFTEGEFFIGCNYWAKNAGMYMWSDWRPDVVEAELSALAKHGCTVMRVFPLWSDFQPLTGDLAQGGAFRSFRFRDNRPLPNAAGVDDEMIRRFAWFCDCAERHGISFIVGIVTGWMSGRQFVPPVFEGRNVLTDPEAIMWQTRFVRHFVSALKGKKAIVAWDLGNECNCMGSKTQAEFYNWMDHIGMAIRQADATRPVVSGMHGLKTDENAAVPIRLNAELMDILCTHPYPWYVPGCGSEPYNTMRTELHSSAESLLYRDIGGKTCFIEEIGNLGASCNSDARTAAGLRTILFSAWANDLKGLLWWCNSDQEGLGYPPYTLTANERELGMLRQDLSPKPVMLEMESFQKFRASLPFRKLPPRRTNAVIVVPEKTNGWIAGFGAYLLCKQAGIEPVFAGAEHELPSASLYVIASGTSDQSYSYPAQKRFWEKAERDGATVLVIYSSSDRFTALREHTGLEVDYCCLKSSQKTFTLPTVPGRTLSVSDSTTVRLIARECEVLAKTSDGEPFFARCRRGKGQVMLVNAPIDRQTIDRTDVLSGEKLMPYYQVFRTASKAAGIKATVTKGDCPYVGITEHPLADGSCVAIAVNYEPRQISCPISIRGKLGRVWRGDVAEDRIVLAANEAALFEVVGR